jgi:hypothetical protein
MHKAEINTPQIHTTSGQKEPAPRPTPPGLRFFVIFLVLSTTMMGVLLFVFMRQNRALQADLVALTARLGSSALPSGELLVTLSTIAPATEMVSDPPELPLGWSDGRLGTLLFIHTGSCATCTLTLPEVSRLASLHRPVGLEVIGIQTDAERPEDLRYNDQSFPVRGVPQAGTTWLRRVPLVPALLLVDHEGRLIQSWYGQPNDAQWDQIRQALTTLTGAS